MTAEYFGFYLPRSNELLTTVTELAESLLLLTITNLKESEAHTKSLEYCPAVILTYIEGTSLRGVKNVTQYSATQSLQSSTATQRNTR